MARWKKRGSPQREKTSASAAALPPFAEMHLAVSPVMLGKGEPLLAGIDLPALGFKVDKAIAGEGATHYLISR
jgi:dihydrofolate reductase